MRKKTWEITKLNRARCEICNGAFGLTRHRVAQKQFCSKQCLERYRTEQSDRVSSFKQNDPNSIKD